MPSASSGIILVVVAAMAPLGAILLEWLRRRWDRDDGRADPPVRIPWWRRMARIGVLFRVGLASWVMLLVGVVAGVGLALAAGRRPVDRGAPTAARVGITYPAESTGVEMRETIRGSSAGVSPDDSIWVVIYIPELQSYFPQERSADVQAGGGWSARVQIGNEGDAGVSFEVLAVTADRRARREFRRYLEQGRQTGRWEGLPRLPGGALEYERVAVARRVFQPTRFTSPGGRFAVVEGEPGGYGILEIHDGSGRLLREVVVTQHIDGDFPNPLKALAWSPDETLFAVLYHHGSGGHVSLVSAETGREIDIREIDDQPHSLSFSADGRFIRAGRTRLPVADGSGSR